MTRQINLPLAFNIEHTFENFFSSGNEESIDHLRHCAKGMGEFMIFIWGEEGLGKTHLLQACSKEAHGFGRSVSYLPLKDLNDPHFEILEGLEHQQCVCLDDIDAVQPNPLFEHALFHLFNRIKEQNHRLIVSAKIPPSKLSINLADLKTRLSFGLTLMLKPLNDEDKLTVLKLHAKALGFSLSKEVSQFLINHQRRDLADLKRLLGELDYESLSVKNKLTVPFIKKYLAKNL